MTCIQKKVNKLAEWNLLHGILSPPKQTKNQISITLLFYKDVWIYEKVKWSLITL